MYFASVNGPATVVGFMTAAIGLLIPKIVCFERCIRDFKECIMSTPMAGVEANTFLFFVNLAKGNTQFAMCELKLAYLNRLVS